MRSSTVSSGDGGGGGGGSGGKMVYTSCQDCGNKAKRDCEHKRCRTCCKSRGFQCPTHVKSTWVPVARRRHRQLLHQHRHHHHLLFGGSGGDNHHCPLPLSLSTTSHYPYYSPSECGNLPEELNSWATFRCIRVNSEDNVVDQYAYQTSVTIGGHIFKGILYYQGPINSCDGAEVETSSAATSDNHHFHRHRFDITTTSVAAPPPSSGGGDLLNFHPTLYSNNNALFPGMQFFPNPRP